MFLLSNLALPEVLNGNMTSEEVFSLFNDNNILNLELGLCNKGEFNINMSEETMKIIKENANKYRITLRSVSTTCLNKANYEYDESGENEALNIIKKMIDIASFIGIPTVSFHGRKIPIKNYHKINYEEMEFHFLREVTNYAESKNVICCLENRIDGYIKKTSHYVDIVSQINSNYLKLCYDTGNGIFSSNPQEWINSTNKKYVKLIHFSDVRVKSLRGILLEFVKPGTGIIDFSSICDLYNKSNFMCDIVIEHYFNSKTETAHELKNILNKFNIMLEV